MSGTINPTEIGFVLRAILRTMIVGSLIGAQSCSSSQSPTQPPEVKKSEQTGTAVREQWTFTMIPSSEWLIADSVTINSPRLISVGNDGTIYAEAMGGRGLFALRPDGSQ